MPTLICKECCAFVEKINCFCERYLLADKMFIEILELKKVSKNDLLEIRSRYLGDQDEIVGYSLRLQEEEPPSSYNTPVEVPPIEEPRPLRTRRKPKKIVDEKPNEVLSDTNSINDDSQNFLLEQVHLMKEFKEDEDDKKEKSCQKGKVKRIHKRIGNVCKICSKSYTRKYLLDVHMKSVHSDEKLPFPCSICSKSFITPSKLKAHNLVHLPDSERLIHPCEFCGKKFAEVRQVKSHITVVHQGERPFICEQCGKSFGSKRRLKDHWVTHSEDQPFECQHCSKKFKSNMSLKRHLDTHNGTTYTCSECGISLNTQRTLKMHMLVHSDVKKYKCQHCGNEYKRVKALKEHLILHSGLRPYSCPFCDKTFTNGSNCRSHKRKAHPTELADLEASGQTDRVTNIPKLEQLQSQLYLKV
ncbi:zinc finger protein 660-like [Sergentomyia squamirostris]